MSTFMASIGESLARYLSRPIHSHGLVPAVSSGVLLNSLQPGDVLLVEGHSRISTAIKYLTQSTWSHAALFVGYEPLATGGGHRDHCFVEADTVEGVRSIGIEEFSGFHTRICRPRRIQTTDKDRLIQYAVQRIGHRYDLRNVFDLARYLVPTPPVPSNFRRRMIGLGSGDPTRAICSTLIAQAFQSIRYPILPLVEIQDARRPDCPSCIKEIVRIRHHSLFTPRDFDVSPYFEIIKPTASRDFDYLKLDWHE